jgi:hypothetical protein
MKHLLYSDADPLVPDVICDRNGQVVLGLCKRCGKAEAELDGPCITPADAALAEGFAGEMETAVYSTERAGQAATGRLLDRTAYLLANPQELPKFVRMAEQNTDDYLALLSDLASLRASRDALVRALEDVCATADDLSEEELCEFANDKSDPIAAEEARSMLAAREALAAAKEQQS